jgi:hypothetical protein
VAELIRRSPQGIIVKLIFDKIIYMVSTYLVRKGGTLSWRSGSAPSLRLYRGSNAGSSPVDRPRLLQVVGDRTRRDRRGH